jgi:hypothetical protein
MSNIINFKEVAHTREKNRFYKMLDNLIDLSEHHYRQRIIIDSMEIERIKDIDLDNDDEIDKASDRVQVILDRISDDMTRLDADINILLKDEDE